MKSEIRHYDVTPRLLRADEEAILTVRPLFGHVRFAAGKAYRVEHYLMDGPVPGRSSPCILDHRVKPDRDGTLRIRSRFPGEQEHCLRITPAQIRGQPASHKGIPIELRVYSLRPDLFARRPYKGDTHMHSSQSDGGESPAYVASACRRIGLDFMAVTDHHRYEPSLEAIRAFAGVKLDLAMYPGEEVHPPDVPVHMVNFGGRFSVNKKFRTVQYQREFRKLVASLAGTLPPGVVPGHAAGCLWSFAKIREAGGLSVFCHPHWVHDCTYNVAEALNDWLFRKRPFDAFELIGGYWRSQLESNQLQSAWYTEQIGRGRAVPVVGASDAHGCHNDLFGWYYTIAFASSRDGLLDAIREGWSVAVEDLPGDTVRPRGAYRLVKYALFLSREILPLHDELCAEEGRLMLAYCGGDRQAAATLSRLSGRCDRLYDRLWQGTRPRTGV